MEDILISVIVPVYNVEKYLERCVRSIQNQTYSNLEIILVDDGSTDGSPAMCDRFAAEDSRVKVIHQENGGLSSARNAGIDVAGGYIAFVDSDDYLLGDVDFIKKVVSIAEKTQADIIAWLWQYQNTNGDLVVKKENTPQDFCGLKSVQEFARYLYQGSYANGLVVTVCNKLYHHSVIRDIPFEGRICEDDAWNDLVLANSKMVYCIHEFGYVYAQNNASLTNQEFSVNRLFFLDALKQRAKLFAGDDFICFETKKLFLNIYIEYYFEAKMVGIVPYKDTKTFSAYRRALIKAHQLNLKTRIRYGVFMASPWLYKKLISQRR